jgi:hypothetical protein
VTSGGPWRGARWAVRITPGAADDAVLVEQRHPSSPGEARELARAVRAAATQIDGGPPPAGDGHDAEISAGETEGMSHGVLLAVLMKLGGSIELDLADLTNEAMGDPQGRFYGVDMQPLDATRVRLAVVNPHTDEPA